MQIIMKKYEDLKELFKKDALSNAVTDCFFEIYVESRKLLSGFDKLSLTDNGTEKQYFVFTEKNTNKKSNKISRAVNKDLFLSRDNKSIQLFFDNIKKRDFNAQTAKQLTKVCYTIAISFCCCIDLHKENDQKTPGTYFEYLMGHLIAVRLNVVPKKQIDISSLEMRTSLPTDFIFDLGQKRPKFHVPVKTSTRERVVQVWAHQRVLDGVYGTGRFLGLLTCLSETKVDRTEKSVTEICLPEQWKIYQLFIAQLKRIYYLDVPQRYNQLNSEHPPICVKPFGEFFTDITTLLA